MKKLIILPLLLISNFAFAHGSPATQAAAAIEAAVASFNASATREMQRNFLSITALMTGHEHFTVTVNLKDNNSLGYDCTENEDAEPVVWECKTK